MKFTIRLVLMLVTCILFSFNIQAQTDKMQTYVIQFRDKGINLNKALNPIDYLSAKAVERRIKFNIPFTTDDLPVNLEYIEDVKHSGIKILAYSRWFNLIVVEANPVMVSSIEEKSFVKNIKLIDTETSSSRSGVSVSDSKFGTISPWFPKKAQKQAASDAYDYGAGFAQINQINGIPLHNSGFNGKGMTIAVLDAGFNSVDMMNCFDSLRANNQIKATRNFVQPGGNVYSSMISDHGTNVLSLMASYKSGELIGTAPKADYYLIRTEDAPTEYILEEYFWVMGAEYADSVGVDLINSSLGYTQFDNHATDHTYADMDGNTTMITRGADKAAEKGILVVNSAGNEGYSLWKYIGAPADGDSVFSIGAVDANGFRVGFSSVGPTYDKRIKPDVCANGYLTAVYSPGGINYGSGTSYSSPITCGMTACFWQANPTLNNMEVIHAIKLTSSLAGGQVDTLMGWGIPNYEKAFTTLSIPEKSVIAKMVCFPNPFTESITLTFQDALPLGELNIELFDMNAQLAYKSVIGGNGLKVISINNLSHLTKGLYLMRASAGNKVFTCKVRKQ